MMSNAALHTDSLSSATDAWSGCTPVERPPRLASGARVEDRLTITGLLGRGGMSEVYGAWDEHASRHVAVKLMLVDAYARAQHAIVSEARALLRVRHAHLVSLHGVGAVDGAPFLELEALDSTTLAGLVRARGPLSLAEGVTVIAQVASALAALHRAGVAHRDVKAENVLFDGEGRAVLCDLGLAAHAEDVPLPCDRSLVGTPTHMAPEVLLGGVRTLEDCFAADQYALAVLVHHALSGRLPYEASGHWALAYAHLSLEPEPLSRHRAEAPPSLDAALLRALSKRPEARFPSVEAFCQALLVACQEAKRATALLAPLIAA